MTGIMAEEKAEPFVDYNNKSLKELLDNFQHLIDSGDQRELYKHAEMIKAAFYKVLKREKIASGFVAPTETVGEPKPETADAKHETAEPAQVAEANPETAVETPEVEPVKPADAVSTNPFAEVEKGFKVLYAQYKTMRQDYLKESEQHKEENLTQKEAVIEKLKALAEKPDEDINVAFRQFHVGRLSAYASPVPFALGNVPLLPCLVRVAPIPLPLVRRHEHL